MASHPRIATLALMFGTSIVMPTAVAESLAPYFDLERPVAAEVAEVRVAEAVGMTPVADSLAHQCGYFDDCEEYSVGPCNGYCDAEPCIVPELLLGCFCPTPGCFDDWISPITNPVYFEDPRTLTEVRGIFLQHKVPSTAGGGDIQVYAVQLRAALTDRLSLIATKDGYAVSSNPLIRDGWADVALGLKYNLIRDYETQSLLSTGLVYEMPVGSPRTHQGNGDGEFHLFLTGGTTLCCDWHYLSAFGLRLPADDEAEETSLYWSNHIDYYLGRGFYVLTEFNWYHWLESGNGGVPGISGGDLFNFGSTGVAGNDIVTGAFGVKYKPNRLTEVGIA